MKKIAYIVLIFLIPVIGYGFDLGGNIDDSTYYKYITDSSLYHTDTLSLWLSGNLWKDADFFMQGSYKYTSANPYFFDLDFLKLNIKDSDYIELSLGRFLSRDPTGLIFNQKIDGITLTVNNYNSIFTAVTGYTGFLFKDSSNVVMTLADSSDLNNDNVFFAAPRLITGVNIIFPDLYKAQNLSISVWVETDLRKNNIISEGSSVITGQGGTLDLFYAGTGLDGTITPSLFYDSFVFISIGKTLSYISPVYTYKKTTSFMAFGGLQYYVNDFLFSRLSFKFIYSSGDSDYNATFLEGNTKGSSTLFSPISSTPLAMIFSPKLGNIFLSEFSYSLKPFAGHNNTTLNDIQLILTDYNFFRSTSGQISEGGINSVSTNLYLGTELDSTVNYRPFSDLGISLSSGIFLPNNGADGAFLKTQRKIEFMGKISLSFSF